MGNRSTEVVNDFWNLQERGLKRSLKYLGL